MAVGLPSRTACESILVGLINMSTIRMINHEYKTQAMFCRLTVNSHALGQSTMHVFHRANPRCMFYMWERIPNTCLPQNPTYNSVFFKHLCLCFVAILHSQTVAVDLPSAFLALSNCRCGFAQHFLSTLKLWLWICPALS